MVEIKNLGKSTVEIIGEIPVEEFESAYKQALEEYNKKVQVPGFRAGKVPEKMLIEKMGENIVLERAAEIAIQKIYPKILKEHKIDAIGKPQVTITKLARKNPLGFKLITTTMPEVKLPDYKKIAAEVMANPPAGREEIKVEEKEIEDSLEYIRKSKAKNKPAVRSGGKPAGPHGGRAELDDGQTEPELPELNDEFAKSVGNFNTLRELKDAIKTNIQFEKELKAREKKRMETIDKIANKSSIDVPEIMIEAEIEKIRAEMKSSIENMGLKWDEYLKHLKRDEGDLQKEWRSEAERRVRHGLILNAINNEENIQVKESELDEYIKNLMRHYPESEKARLTELSSVDKNRFREYSYGILKNEKVFQLLEQQ